MWNAEERYQLGLAAIKARETGGDETAMIGARAVELVAARGGTMTPSQIASMFEALGGDDERAWSDTQRWCSTEVGPLILNAREQGAKVATLQAKVAELEGEVTGLRTAFDDEQGIARRALNERDTLRAEVERLKAELAEASPYQEMWEAATRELGALSSKAETVRAMWKERAETAESRLAAIREMDIERACEVMHDAYEAAAKEAGWETQARSRKPWADVPEANKVTMRAAVTGLKRWILKGDAPQEAKCTCNMLQRDTQWHDSDCPMAPPEVRAAHARRYPCSPTCTHDDAATPGHPQRVKERSEAVREVASMADVDPIAALAKKAGAKNGREVASFRVGHEQGAEAMRAACWEVVVERLVRHGLQNLRADFKAAIEGVAP